jgi:hypothetical protein
VQPAGRWLNITVLDHYRKTDFVKYEKYIKIILQNPGKASWMPPFENHYFRLPKTAYLM